MFHTRTISLCLCVSLMMMMINITYIFISFHWVYMSVPEYTPVWSLNMLYQNNDLIVWLLCDH